eukprot:TRINITY_DN1762_c0_g1_i1.p1 TRINITY_DN1762_c0_g1~~TRINITY_DN1762_c0_g1_i1.p1  ORF type:complete len:328 (-),score=80.68 TRINITY_DN1762_c0_g1_i1:252-1235(-)
MSFFGGKKGKGPADLVRQLQDLLNTLDRKKDGKTLADIAKALVDIKVALYGDGETEPSNEASLAMAMELWNGEVLQALISRIGYFEFEPRKDVGQIFNNCLRRPESPLRDRLDGPWAHVLETLIKGYEMEHALNCGIMLRECIRIETLAKRILNSRAFFRFFEFVELSKFDVASDAFATFRDLLTKHKTVAAQFLEQNFDVFFEVYHRLLNSGNYVTRRQSIRLLGEILLDRANFNVMTKYIANPEHMKMMMNLLRDKSKNIQYEAFHVFKIFVANPNKAKPIKDILVKNKEKLITFLNGFQTEKDEEQFSEEKALLLSEITKIEPS